MPKVPADPALFQEGNWMLIALKSKYLAEKNKNLADKLIYLGKKIDDLAEILL
jgi:hypothetical protein